MRRASTAAAAALGGLVCARIVAGAAGSFPFQREVTPARPGPNRLEPDAELLGGAAPVRHHAVAGRDGKPWLEFASGLSDLRFFDAAGREVPYLLIPPVSPREGRREARVSLVAPTKTRSGFEADLGSPLRVDGVRIEGLPTPFLKRFLLEGSGDRAHWTVLEAEGSLFELPRERLKRTNVDFAPQDLRYLRVTWDDRTSARVPAPRAVSARLGASGGEQPALAVPVSFERRASEPGKSRFRLRLPGRHLPVRSLEVSSGKNNILREARVTEPRLSGGEVIPLPLGSGMLRQAVVGDAMASEMTIATEPPEGAELDLSVDDGDNPPFELTGVTARMGPLPWIYFEAADAKPLVARWGEPNAAAPRYDLEARREAVAKSSPPRAAWGAERPVTGYPAPPTPAVPESGAPLGTAEFPWLRPVTSVAAGLNVVPLDAAVLAHGALPSLRIVDETGRQVPYLLEMRDEPLPIDLPPLEKVKAKGDPAHASAYRLVLPFALLPKARLVLATDARVYERAVALTVEAEDGGRDVARTRTVASAVWRHADAETPAPALVLDVPRLPVAEARLVVDEGDNSPLPIGVPRLLLPSYRLRFFASPGAKPTLFYGASLEAPRYDLALLAPRLVGSQAHEAALGPEAANASAATKGAVPRVLFWGVLVAAVAALLVLLARLSRPAAG